MIELVLQRIFCKSIGRRRFLAYRPQHPSLPITQINLVRPDGPEVQEERGVNDVEDDGRGEHQPSHPVVRHPIELDANLGKERCNQQREHRDGHEPVKGARDQGVSGDSFGNSGQDCGRIVFRKLLGRGKDGHVECVDNHEEQSRNHRNPYQVPRYMDGNGSSPRTDCPGYEVHVASCTPPMARFTRFLINGILYALNCSGTAPWTARFPAIVPVVASAGLPRTASSTALKRIGFGATALTAMGVRSILPPETTIAEATFIRAKSHTLRSRTFSK